jgi:phage shock protein A
MFKAIARWFKALGYLLTGQVDSARRTLDSNPHVIRAKFDEIVDEKTKRIHQYKQAVAKLIAQEQRKVGKLKELGEEIERLERLKAGALAKAKQATERLKGEGKSMEEIKADEDYRRCLTAFNDFNSTLAEKQQRVAELEADVEEYRKTISDHKVQLQGLLRELEKVKSESAETVADVITAKQEQEIADTLAGIAQDGTAEELQQMRELRQELRAEVKISRELSGSDAKVQEQEFLQYARESEASHEFDALLGLADEPAAAAPETAAKESLPE